jgi:hypothetical protein
MGRRARSDAPYHIIAANNIAFFQKGLGFIAGAWYQQDCRIFDTKKDSMKVLALKFGVMGLLAAVVAGTPVGLHAQSNNVVLPGVIKINKDQIPFRGKLKEIDTNANTITINSDTIRITPETKITRTGKPATLADAAPGEVAAGSYRKEADGTLKAIDMRLAPKHITDPAQAKTNKTDKATSP